MTNNYLNLNYVISTKRKLPKRQSPGHKYFSYCAILLFFIIYGNSATAQVRFGVVAHPQYTWMASETADVTNLSGKIGFNGGLILENYFAENYAIMSGISISVEGGKLSYEDTLQYIVNDARVPILPETKLDYSLQYVQIPLGLKLKSNEIGYTTFFANLGFTAGINIKARLKDSEKHIQDENISEEIKLFNLGYHFGGGIEYSLGGNTSVLAGVTFVNGFVDITGRNEDKVTMKNISLRLGILF